MVKRLQRSVKKKSIKDKKEQQNFEKDPPLCRNCKNRFKDPVPVKGLGFQLSRCKVGGFTVKAYSVCDQWLGRYGETVLVEGDA